MIRIIQLFQYIVFGLLLCFAAPFGCLGTELPRSINQDGSQVSLVSDDDLPWKIYADSLNSVNDGVVVEGKGNVLLVRGEDYLKADFARLYTNTQWILLQGNVYAKLGADEVEASEAEFDLTNSTGWLREARLFLAGPHMYFKSEELIKKGESRYGLIKASATTCDGDVPLWKIEASEADLEVDSYAHFSDVIFNVKDNGILYLPYFIAPTKTTRQSGLLVPNYGVSSTQGFYYTQPYFHVIDQSRDLTFYGTIMTEKGFMPSLEYRSHTKEKEKTWAMVDFLYDSSRVMNEGEDDVDRADGLLRTNRTRYWLRAMGDGDILESDWNYKYNLDYVSDQNFIREFSSRMTGYDYTDKETNKIFGRSFALQDEDRITEGFVYRHFKNFYVTAGMKYTQDPKFGHGNLSHKYDTTVQQLPQLGLYWNREQMVSGLPFEWNMQTNLGYYYRRSGTRGTKAEIYPEILLPFSIGFLRGELIGAGRGTLYRGISGEYNSLLGGGSEKVREQQGNADRFIPEFRANVYAQADRVWYFNEEYAPIRENVGKSEIVALKHSIQPRISYAWVDEVDQEDNPFFTMDDRIQDQDNLIFRLDNIWTVKNSAVSQQKDGIKKISSYLDMVTLKMTTGFDFREDRRKRYTDIYESRPWHDLRTRLTFRPLNWLSFNGDFFYSFYDGKVNRTDIGTTLYYKNLVSLHTSYSHRYPNYDYRHFVNYDNFYDIVPTQKINVVTNTLTLNPVPEFHLYIMERTNLETGKSYERIVGLGYKHQCLYLFGEYTKDQIEERVSLNVELTGLGF